MIVAVHAAFSHKDANYRDAVLGILDCYGTESWERERERVQLAILELARGDEERLLYLVDVAKKDYRDILMWQSMPPLSPEQGAALQARVREIVGRWGVKL